MIDACIVLSYVFFQKTFDKLGQEVKVGAANWELMTNRYFDIVEQKDILSKADEFLSEVRFETTLLPLFEKSTLDRDLLSYYHPVSELSLVYKIIATTSTSFNSTKSAQYHRIRFCITSVTVFDGNVTLCDQVYE